MKKFLSVTLAVLIFIWCASAGFAGDSLSFSDLPEDHWACPYISKLVSLGIFSGYPDGTFKPDNEITTAEFLKALMELFYKYAEATGVSREYIASFMENPGIPRVTTEKYDDTAVLVNKRFHLPRSFVPPDLVKPNIRFSGGAQYLRKEAAQALEKLFRDAEKAGITLYGRSGYRSYEQQDAIYRSNVQKRGENVANTFSAKPSQSEHQTGLAMDITTKSIGFQLHTSFGKTMEGKWVNENARFYGFIIRYPREKEHITGYMYEPWHLRYVGVELASILYETKLTLDEYYLAQQKIDGSWGREIAEKAIALGLFPAEDYIYIYSPVTRDSAERIIDALYSLGLKAGIEINHTPGGGLFDEGLPDNPEGISEKISRAEMAEILCNLFFLKKDKPEH